MLIDVTVIDLDHIALICEIAHDYHKAASHYSLVDYDDGSKALFLYWHHVPGATPLAYELKNPTTTAMFIRGWIASEKKHGPREFEFGQPNSISAYRVTNNPCYNFPENCSHKDILVAIEPIYVNVHEQYFKHPIEPSDCMC